MPDTELRKLRAGTRKAIAEEEQWLCNLWIMYMEDGWTDNERADLRAAMRGCRLIRDKFARFLYEDSLRNKEKRRRAIEQTDRTLGRVDLGLISEMRFDAVRAALGRHYRAPNLNA